MGGQVGKINGETDLSLLDTNLDNKHSVMTTVPQSSFLRTGYSDCFSQEAVVGGFYTKTHYVPGSINALLCLPDGSGPK